MTWLKLSDDFGDQCADLSDTAFRTHVEALLWTMRRETAGVVTTRDVSRFAESADGRDAVTELVARGFWDEYDNGYLIRHHMEHQPEPEVLTARRRNDAERQRRKRRKAAGLENEQAPSRRDSPRDDTRDHPRDPGRVGSGTGKPNPSLEEKREGVRSLHGQRCQQCERISGFSLIGGRCRKCHEEWNRDAS